MIILSSFLLVCHNGILVRLFAIVGDPGQGILTVIEILKRVVGLLNVDDPVPVGVAVPKEHLDLGVGEVALLELAADLLEGDAAVVVGELDRVLHVDHLVPHSHGSQHVVVTSEENKHCQRHYGPRR